MSVITEREGDIGDDSGAGEDTRRKSSFAELSIELGKPEGPVGHPAAQQQ